MRCKSVFILVFAVFFIGLASASFVYSDNGSIIKTQYEPSGYLEAAINISFFNQSLNSNFTDSLGNLKTLATLLNQSTNYHCMFYDLSNTSVSCAFQILQIGGTNFQMSATEGNLTYKLNLSGQKVFEKTMQIISAGNSIEEALSNKYSQLNNSKQEIKKYNPSIQNLLNQFLNITNIENSLEELEEEYENASVSEYTYILDSINSIKIPTRITQRINVNPMAFYPNIENVNINALAGISGEEFTGKEEEYVDAVYLWNNENLATTLAFKDVDIFYESGEQSNLKIFTFNFDKTNLEGDAYFIIQNIENLTFENLTLEISEYYGYSYLNMADIPNTLSLSTTTAINFLDIPAFISPQLENLTPVTIEEPDRWTEPKKWLLFGVIIFILILIGIITYVLLQIWYRKKYETYLFKTKNNMYNIMVYIQNAKRKGMTKENIANNLKKAGWANEQISYALKKYEGKKIPGIVHHPLNMGAENAQKRPERR